MNDDPSFDDEIAPESKSARKRQMHALQDLGEQLVSLSPAQLAKLDIDNETLIDSVLLAQRISHRSGKRRQMQFIGKLMRNVDAEQIAVALDELHETSRKAKAVEHVVEGARDALLLRGDDAIGEVLSIWPNGDRQLIRQLSRSAKDERVKNAPPVSARKLFRYLRSLADESSDD
jgi:ribosome-associated protein